jgi:hypothetical protein
LAGGRGGPSRGFLYLLRHYDRTSGADPCRQGACSSRRILDAPEAKSADLLYVADGTYQFYANVYNYELDFN